ncbi:MAG: hypothetical protein A4E63_02972 [Syntrophorhabdus sp. PtaU1.Bin050]|jgi:hypothetical protein|nr:MAG: hypothetical protein A4E63_02972 [Syntrophorhabdus sp. PtaU1.Bin050]
MAKILTGHKIFEGKVSWEGFKITRIIHYRNSFLPIVQGRFRQEEPGISISVRMYLHPFVIAFMCLWFGGIGFGICMMGKGIASGHAAFTPFLLIPFGMLFLGWMMVSGGFRSEAKKAKVSLNDILLSKGTTSEQDDAADIL